MTLEKLYKMSNWSEGRLASLVDVSQPTLNRVKSGVAQASLGLALRIQFHTDALVMAKDLPMSARARAELKLIPTMARWYSGF